MNHRVDIREDIKRYQDTLSYASSKVDYSIGESIYMLPSNMNLKIKTGAVGYNNKILVSDGKFILGKNEKVNLVVPAMKSYKTNSLVLEEPVISHEPQTTTHIGHHGHSDERLLWYFLWQVVLQYGICFDLF